MQKTNEKFAKPFENVNFYLGESISDPIYRPALGRIRNIQLDRFFIGKLQSRMSDLIKTELF